MSDIKKLLFQKINKECKRLNLQAAIIPDGDFFLNEYTAEEDNIRKQISGFLGSVGQSFICHDSLHLVVDGRYKIQAKQQFHGEHLHFVNHTPQIKPFLIKKLESSNIKKVGVWLERMSAADYSYFSKCFELTDLSYIFNSNFASKAPNHLYQTDAVRINLAEHQVFFTHQVDAIARVTGLRSDFFPFMSSLPGLAFVTKENVFLLNTLNIDKKFDGIEFFSVEHLLDLNCLEGVFEDEFENIIYDPCVTNQSTVDAVCKFLKKNLNHA